MWAGKAWVDGWAYAGWRNKGTEKGGADRRDIEVEILICNPWKGVGVRRASAGVGMENMRIRWERVSYLISGCGRVS